MTRARAPKVATFLMSRIGNCDPILIGDLEEEYRHGRSRLWFWREAVHASVVALLRAVRQHPVQFFRGILALWIINATIGVAIYALTDARVVLRIVPVWLYTGYQLSAILGILVSAPAITVATWFVAQWHRPVRVPATFVLLAWSVPGLALDPELHRLWANMPDPRFVPYLALHVTRSFVWIGGTLLGGMLLPVRPQRLNTGQMASPER
jgi:hypothetical protein